MRATSLARHTVDVLTILVLGFVYLLALSVGTVVTTGRHKLASVVTGKRSVNRRSDDPTRHSH
jgi:hypothetical protein